MHSTLAKLYDSEKARKLTKGKPVIIQACVSNNKMHTQCAVKGVHHTCRIQIA